MALMPTIAEQTHLLGQAVDNVVNRHSLFQLLLFLAVDIVSLLLGQARTCYQLRDHFVVELSCWHHAIAVTLPLSHCHRHASPNSHGATKD